SKSPVQSRPTTRILKPPSSRCLPVAQTLARRPARQTTHPQAPAPGQPREDKEKPALPRRQVLFSFFGCLPWYWTEWLLLAHKVILVDGHRNALLLPRLVHAQHLSRATHANRIGQCDLRGQGHHKFDSRADADRRVEVDEDPASAYVTRVSGHLVPAVIQELHGDGQVQREAPDRAFFRPRLRHGQPPMQVTDGTDSSL